MDDTSYNFGEGDHFRLEDDGNLFFMHEELFYNEGSSADTPTSNSVDSFAHNVDAYADDGRRSEDNAADVSRSRKRKASSVVAAQLTVDTNPSPRKRVSKSKAADSASASLKARVAREMQETAALVKAYEGEIHQLRQQLESVTKALLADPRFQAPIGPNKYEEADFPSLDLGAMEPLVSPMLGGSDIFFGATEKGDVDTTTLFSEPISSFNFESETMAVQEITTADNSSESERHNSLSSVYSDNIEFANVFDVNSGTDQESYAEGPTATERKVTRSPGSSSVNGGRWSSEEHDLFIRCLEIYGRNWEAVSTCIPSRSIIQVRSHAQKYFKKLNKEAPAAVGI